MGAEILAKTSVFLGGQRCGYMIKYTPYSISRVSGISWEACAYSASVSRSVCWEVAVSGCCTLMSVLHVAVMLNPLNICSKIQLAVRRAHLKYVCWGFVVNATDYHELLWLEEVFKEAVLWCHPYSWSCSCSLFLGTWAARSDWVVFAFLPHTVSFILCHQNVTKKKV